MIKLPNGSYTMTELPPYVSVGKYSSIGKGVIFHSLEQEHQWSINHKCVYTTNWDQPTETGRIVIGNDVWIGDNVRILSNAIIHDGAIIGAGSVVREYVVGYTVSFGDPCLPRRVRFTQDQIDKLLAIKWWDWPESVIIERKEEMKDIETFLQKYG